MEKPELGPGARDLDRVLVRELRADDLEWVVRIDREHSGRPRTEYFRLKLREAQTDTGVRISLAALVDGTPAGFLIGRLYYGDFGVPEPVAELDTIGVSAPFRGQRVATALLAQLRMNLMALHIDRIETQVAWDQQELLAFFQRAGFRLASRLCLECPVPSSDRPE